MDDLEKDNVPMLSAAEGLSDKHIYKSKWKLLQRNRNFLISIPESSIELNSSAKSHIGSARKTPRVWRQGKEPVEQDTRIDNHHLEYYYNESKNKHTQLRTCDDPNCIKCPNSYNYKAQLISGVSEGSGHRHVKYTDAKGWAQRKLSSLKHFTFGVLNPHMKIVQRWNQFIVLSCLFAIFIDPLCFYLLSVRKDNNCIVIDWPMTKAIVAFRSMTDFIYLMHMLVQFRLAYVSPESRAVGAGDLVDDPRKIALHYLSGFFFLDLFIVLPLPQIIILIIIPHANASLEASHSNNLLRSVVLMQYIPRLYRFLPLLAGQSPTGLLFESAWANIVINLLTFVLAGHVVGSSWYLLGLQRVNQCLRDACNVSAIKNCLKFIDCGRGTDFGGFRNEPQWNDWKQNKNATACFSVSEDGFPYGIYVKAVNLVTEKSIITRYVYSFFWGFQQISTLAGNQTPSYYVWEILFTMTIIGLGLLLFALLIGNMQNFLQGLGRRRLEMSLTRHDYELWMGHRNLPEDLRSKVRESEHYRWAATRGVNEESLMENLPEDLQRDIRRHLFEFVKKVRILASMDEPILDAICEKLRPKTYIKGGKALCHGGVVTNMIFIVRGKMESMGEDGNKVQLSEGDVCGEELLIWCFQQPTNTGGKQGRLLSNRTVTCLSNVEAFVLRAADLEEVTSLFSGFLRSQRVQTAIRNESPYWQVHAATTIQVAWRYWRKKRNRAALSRARASYIN